MWPNIIVVVARRPSSWAVIITSAHSAVRDLVRAQVDAHAVVEDLGGGARQGAQAGVAQAGEELAHADPEGVGALPDLERREAVHVHLRAGAP